MSKTNSWEADLLALFFQNADAAGIGDATGLRGSSAAGSLWISLHTASPGEAGNQETSEANYGSYARVSVARTSGQWSISNSEASNDNEILFPEATSGENTVTHFGVGTSESGAGKLLYYGALTPAITVGVGIAPRFAPGNLTVTED